MLNRWIGIVCTILMVSANATLLVRDVLPGWLAGNPPEPDDLHDGVVSRGIGVERCAQIGIFNAAGRNVGRSWTISSRQSGLLNIASTTTLHAIALPNGVATPPVRIDTQLKYREEDHLLNELFMSIRGLPLGVVLRGEFVPPDAFACKWQVGPRQRGKFAIDARATRAMGEVIRPFGRLPGLYVGRAWRLQLLDPLSHMLPGLRPNDLLADYELVRVTRTETVAHQGRSVEVFVVEGRRMCGWVTRDGEVVRQEVELPLVGKLILASEPFDRNAYQNAKQWPTGDLADDLANEG